mmetsp:Transcript_10238/g.18440  ORF Transcript_10238/g.18440 Transcript_10238/m.18440 type:complete len:87 (+) Transcript_10238:45-305(+)
MESSTFSLKMFSTNKLIPKHFLGLFSTCFSVNLQFHIKQNKTLQIVYMKLLILLTKCNHKLFKCGMESLGISEFAEFSWIDQDIVF